MTRPMFKQSILIRDNNKCVICNDYMFLRVHHILPKRFGGTDDPNNLITLCAACHYAVEKCKHGPSVRYRLKDIGKDLIWFYDRLRELKLINGNPHQQEGIRQLETYRPEDLIEPECIKVSMDIEKDLWCQLKYAQGDFNLTIREMVQEALSEWLKRKYPK
jgi:hypothetical protein